MEEIEAEVIIGNSVRKKIYIAHNYEARDWLKNVFIPQWLLQHEITSSWIFKDHEKDTNAAEEDIGDILRSDLLFLFVDPFTADGSKGRGKWFEAGLAMGQGINVLALGEDEGCVFVHAADVFRIKTPEEIEDKIKEIFSV